jgi:hypothetical protein
MDLTELRVAQIRFSEDRKKVRLDIPGLKENRVVYLRLPSNWRSAGGQPLWSGEAWYTLNTKP